MGPDVKGNPLYISVYLLIASYIIGEFIFPKYPLLYILNLFGLLIIILMPIVFFPQETHLMHMKKNYLLKLKQIKL